MYNVYGHTPYCIVNHWVIKGAIHCVIPFYSAFMIVLSASINISIWRTMKEQALKTESPHCDTNGTCLIHWIERKLLYPNNLCSSKKKTNKVKETNNSHWRITWKLQRTKWISSQHTEIYQIWKKLSFSFRCIRGHHYQTENKTKIQCGKMDLLLAAMPEPLMVENVKFSNWLNEVYLWKP